ncbi:MAG TPA: acyl-CoA dehydrogenase family protein [Candidatus Binataceae bacterium]|nr:acyl-CoA dehydrogenase family protein [Candidatus Binataceae bacterium]
MDTYVELEVDFPPEIAELKDAVHRFSKNVLRPTAIALDRLADPQQVIDRGSILWKFMRSAYELGYHTATIPAELGGLGLHGLSLHVFLEELGWGSADLAISLGVAGFPFGALAQTGDRDLIEQYVKPFVADREARYIGCWPVTEPAHGSDWGGSILDDNDATNKGGRVIARREGDNYVINGQKSAWVSNGTISTHGLTYLMAAAHNDIPRGAAAAFIPFDLPGVSKGKPLNKLGQRALNQGEIFFDNVKIPAKYMLASPDNFQMLGAKVLTSANGTMGAVFTGVARAAFEAAFDYSRQRIQGGKPICEHQLVQKRLFEMFTKVEACRRLSRATMIYNDRAAVPALEYAMAAKTFCTQAAFEIASDAVQLFGGNGLSKEYQVEKLFRDARAALIEDGTNDMLSLAGIQLVMMRS